MEKVEGKTSLAVPSRYVGMGRGCGRVAAREMTTKRLTLEGNRLCPPPFQQTAFLHDI